MSFQNDIRTRLKELKGTKFTVDKFNDIAEKYYKKPCKVTDVLRRYVNQGKLITNGEKKGSDIVYEVAPDADLTVTKNGKPVRYIPNESEIEQKMILCANRLDDVVRGWR